MTCPADPVGHTAHHWIDHLTPGWEICRNCQTERPIINADFREAANDG